MTIKVSHVFGVIFAIMGAYMFMGYGGKGLDGLGWIVASITTLLAGMDG